MLKRVNTQLMAIALILGGLAAAAPPALATDGIGLVPDVVEYGMGGNCSNFGGALNVWVQSSELASSDCTFITTNDTASITYANGVELADGTALVYSEWDAGGNLFLQFQPATDVWDLRAQYESLLVTYSCNDQTITGRQVLLPFPICPDTPTGPTCGNAQCEEGETMESCPADCAATPFVDEATATQIGNDVKSTARMLLVGVLGATIFIVALASGLVQLAYKYVLDALFSGRR